MTAEPEPAQPIQRNNGVGWGPASSPLIVLLGPTASGKTALSLALAERFAGEIVSCDSVSIYRSLVIGTAKPTEEERRRAPHHMLDLVAPDEPFTAGDYARLARQALGEITARGHLPIVAGGTGLYLRALLEGLSQAHSARKSCAGAYAAASGNADRSTCTSCSRGWMRRLPPPFIPMTPPS